MARRIGWIGESSGLLGLRRSLWRSIHIRHAPETVERPVGSETWLGERKGGFPS
ncbi:MAG: hypothetical protein ACT4N2_03195 [Hyphomicrobium sp.]